MGREALELQAAGLRFKARRKRSSACIVWWYTIGFLFVLNCKQAEADDFPEERFSLFRVAMFRARAVYSSNLLP